MPSRSDFQEAFRLLGEYLAYADAPLRIVIVGGTALNLLGIVDRTTTDADVIAFEENGELVVPAIIPPVLKDGITEVASSLRLPSEELAWATEWVRTQDASPDFPRLVAGVVTGVLSHARA